MPDDWGEFDPAAASVGVALLTVQARASDRAQRGWINRRVEHLEFIDTRAVRWLVSIDFDIPEDAPNVERGGEKFLLVPITSLAKANLVAFSLRDEQSAAIWMHTSRETAHYLASALILGASQVMSITPYEVPRALVNDLKRIVSEDPRALRLRPPTLTAASAMIDAEESYGQALAERLEIEKELRGVPFRQVARRRELNRRWTTVYERSSRAWDSLLQARANWERSEASIRGAARMLMENLLFRNLVEELARNFVVHVAAKDAPGTRRIIKLAYESYAPRRENTGGWFYKFLQSMGWRLWQFDVLIGGRGGSYHLEVAAPAGVDVVGITADQLLARVPRPQIGRWRRFRAWLRDLIFWEPAADVFAPGHMPHVHINPPDAAFVRYRAAIFVRVSRPGWLTASWGVTAVIGAAVVAGWRNLPVFFSRQTTGSATTAAQAGTAAILLLSLLGVFATMLVRPGEHPLASRLLRMARFLMLVDVAVVLVGIGYLVLQEHPIPFAVWTGLTVVACTVFVLFTISWLVPVARPPRRE
jgi:hypothetical protein